jgi:hypothetical protein
MTIMGNNRTILLVIATTFFAAGIWSGCTVGFDPGDSTNTGLFPCQTDDDCIEGFRCNEDDLVCEEDVITPVDAPPCDQEANPDGDIDQDNDGYGTGDDRTKCPVNTRQIDCDDNDADVNPGQAELCDAKDNNCDGDGDDGVHRVDEFDCDEAKIASGDATVAEECGSPPFSGLKYECLADTCTLRPFNQNPDLRCDEMFITCNSADQAFTYELDGMTYTIEDVPSPECR